MGGSKAARHHGCEAQSDVHTGGVLRPRCGGGVQGAGEGGNILQCCGGRHCAAHARRVLGPHAGCFLGAVRGVPRHQGEAPLQTMLLEELPEVT